MCSSNISVKPTVALAGMPGSRHCCRREDYAGTLKLLVRTGSRAPASYATSTPFQFGMSSFSVALRGCILAAKAMPRYPAYAGANGSRFALNIYVTSTFSAFLKDASGNTVTLTPPRTFPANSWSFVTMLVDRSLNAMSLYVNDSFVASTSISSISGNILPEGIPLSGGFVSGNNNPFLGSIDDLQVYSRVLALNEVQGLYNNAAVYTHTAALTGLAVSTTYYYYVTSAASGTTMVENDAGADYSLTSTGPPPPVITSFVMPSKAVSTTLAVISFTATATEYPIAGYLITQTSATPSTTNPFWSGSAPTSLTVSGTGPITAYAWVKDSMGGIASSSQAVVIDTSPSWIPVSALGTTWAGDFTSIAGNVINVKTDWRLAVRAAGDGVTDDTAAVRAAIALATSTGGGTLYFPAGTYEITVPSDPVNGSPLIIPSDIILRGQSSSSATIVMNDASSSSETDSTLTWGGMRLKGSSYVGMTDLGITASSSASALYPCATREPRILRIDDGHLL